MISTYTVAEYLEEDRTVEVTFYNEEGFVHKRNINIPHNSDGTVDEVYFQEILEGQLRGVENKIKIGVVQLIDHNQITEPVGIAST